MAFSEHRRVMEGTRTAESPDNAEQTDNPSSKLGHRPPAQASTTAGLAFRPTDRWMKIHLGLLLAALVVLVVAGQGQHFFYDEWAFIGGKLDALPFADRYLLPHNEHWSMFPVLAYRTLLATVGVGSYWPYLGLLLLLHLGVTHVLWRLMLVTGSKPIVATALAAVFSVLGAGAENLVWAFQIGFVGSSLLGVSSVYLAVTGTANWRKTGVLAGLTLASVATSGVGLAYLIVVPLVLARRRRRYAIGVFCLPLLIYVGWYVIYGRSLTHAAQVSANLPLLVGTFVVVGLTAAVTRYFGFPGDVVYLLVVGIPILAGLTLACRDRWTDRALASRTPVAMCIGAVTFFGTVGLARAGLGLGYATVTRYVYVASALLLPAIALVISLGADRRPRLLKSIVPLAIAMAMSNIFQLLTYASVTRHENDPSRRVLVAASDLVRSGSPMYADQIPEPLFAPDITTSDLRSRRLDAAFEDVSPGPRDRLTASLNLQIRVAPDRAAGTATATTAASSCTRVRQQEITVATSRGTAPSFVVSADSTVVLTLHEVGKGSAMRKIDLVKGAYTISSLREAGVLTIESKSPGSLLANC